MLRAAYLNAASTLITTCGADGKAIIWQTIQTEPVVLGETASESINHAEGTYDANENTNLIKESVKPSNITVGKANSNNQQIKKSIKKQAVLSHGAAQIYACECFDITSSSSAMFLTAADSSVYLWDVDNCVASRPTSTPSHVWTLDPNSNNNSSSVSPVNAPGEENSTNNNFGGPRNPNNDVFIFDAKINPRSGNVIALALSDGNIRQIDIRSPYFATSNKTTTPFTPSSNSYFSSSSGSSSSSGFRDNMSYNGRENEIERNFDSDSDMIDSVPNLNSISLSGLSTSPTKKARVGNSHATSVRTYFIIYYNLFLLLTVFDMIRHEN